METNTFCSSCKEDIPDCYGDFLECMFNQQIEYQKLMGNGEMPRLDGELVEHFSMGIVTELGEILQVYKGWKPWKNSDNYTYDKEATEEELADLWHFVINLSMALGYGSEDVYNFFMKKHEKVLSERVYGEGEMCEERSREI